ncbi:hypothetical protein EG028_06205 [Chitinophaga barathri]|uniref:Uncharacterized protein n=1 Tax=Chitinophaga barathri TaxID=1647451 RepID=A0A3N4MDV1_9BACT|nr:hypothetical protein EG028_06205 [Chitinophaga barathri]
MHWHKTPLFVARFPSGREVCKPAPTGILKLVFEAFSRCGPASGKMCGLVGKGVIVPNKFV